MTFFVHVRHKFSVVLNTKEIAARTKTDYPKHTAVTNKTTILPTTLKRQRKLTVILNKILDGKDGSLLLIRSGNLLGKDDELGNDIAPTYNPNTDHQYRIYTYNAECYSV